MKRTVAAVALAALAVTARAESDRWGSFELAAGTYRPNIDAEPGLTSRPFADTFGTGRGWMFRAGIAKSLFTEYGSLEAGISSGYFRRSGYGRMQRDTAVVSGDPTVLNVIPVTLSLTYRADFLFEQVGVPLVPYVRGSLERYNWWVTDGSDSTAKEGATNGWSAALGLCLALDFFDRGLARELDADSGVNHTYVFFEAKKSWIDDFGSSRSWDMSEKSVGLAGGLLFVF